MSDQTELIKLSSTHHAIVRQTEEGQWFADIVAKDDEGRLSIEEYTDYHKERQGAIDQARWYWRMMYGPMEYEE